MKIPVIMMFNDEYAIPSGVAILSLLKNADPKHSYELYILHNDITNEHQDKITSVVKQFPNTSLKFLHMDNKFENFKSDIFFPKELLYKLCIPSLFPKYDYAIITDVDVIFPGDISKEFISFSKDTKHYFAGVKQVQNSLHKPFSTNITDENTHFICGAGYMIYNLKKMR